MAEGEGRGALASAGRVRRLLGAALVLGLFIGVPLSAATGGNVTPAGLVLADGPPTGPTTAWQAFCQQLPAECAVNRREPRRITLTPGLWRLLERVSAEVNRTVRPVTDLAHWGVGDRWDYPANGIGDCEDIQIEKRRRLAAAGLPARAMRMAMVINPEGEGHAVLVVRTDRGDFVLDNRVDAVRRWDRTGYTWVKREGDGGSFWVSLGGVKAATETAARP